jgi:NAD(P)-dependent dehydrogenase (short-subunit alcohol dehydrogenase family)
MRPLHVDECGYLNDSRLWRNGQHAGPREVNILVDLGLADETGFPTRADSISSSIGSLRTRARWWSTFEAAAAKDAGSMELDMLVNNAGIAPAVSLVIKRQGQSSMTSLRSISKSRFF